ncbi:MAG: 4Fe-4S binding protein [Marivivens sp.]|nr:4Fe-4S binding protein [Marivivens sp.]
MLNSLRSLLIVLLMSLFSTQITHAETMTREQMSEFVSAPMALGDPVNDRGVWELLNSGGAHVGYVFETGMLAPLPGFAGEPINMFVAIDLEGRFIDVRLISHHEPIFVSGLGEAPLRSFLEQYRGLSISQPIVVGTPYGNASDGSALVYLDGVTKATASVRIAHESILAATRTVAQEKMQGVASVPPATPNMTYHEDLDWPRLIEQGLAQNIRVTNAEVEAAFEGTPFARTDAEALSDPNGAYLDLWILDIGPPTIARAALGQDTIDQLEVLQRLVPSSEMILLIENGRHGLVGPDFVRNTSPDWVSATQDGLPIQFTLDAEYTAAPRFFISNTGQPIETSPLKEALRNRQTDLIIGAIFVTALLIGLGFGQSRIAEKARLTPVRLSILAFVTVFVGWWGQGQLSIVTVTGVLQALVKNQSMTFLLYDPFSLLIWGAAIVGFVLWGRGLFCGWMCPFGALQEFAHHLGRLLRLPQIKVSDRWDNHFKWMKFLVLGTLIGVALFAPSYSVKAAEVEPFKTAISVFFVRNWYYVAYAVFWLVLGMVIFKGFCRYVCPLGAVMAIGGLLRGRNWIERREACGTPCQLCKVRCNYNAIKKDGAIAYSECFQCFDCVQIFEDRKQCVPLILADRKGAKP